MKNMFLIAMFCFAFLLMASECRSKELNNEAKTYNEAMEMSQTTGKPIFLYFGAKWCGYCQKMKREVLVDDLVNNSLKSFIILKIDIDKDPELAKKYKVRTIPHYVVTSSKDVIIKQDTGYKPKNEFLNWLK